MVETFVFAYSAAASAKAAPALRAAGSFRVDMSWPVRGDTWLATGVGYRRCTVLHEPLKLRFGGRTAVQEGVIGLEREQSLLSEGIGI